MSSKRAVKQQRQLSNMSGERAIAGEHIEQRIDRYRTAEVMLTVRGRRGRVVANAT